MKNAATIGAVLAAWTMAVHGVAAGAAAAEEPRLTADAATRTRLGITTAAVQEVEVPRVARGTGRLLDPTPLVTAWYDVAAARVAFTAADTEYRRVQALQRADSNASRRDLEAAQTAFERARAAQGAAEAHFAVVWGRAGSQPDVAALIDKLARREAAMARIELPLDDTIPAPAATARLRALAGTTDDAVPATVMGEAPDADPTIQGRGVFLLIARPPWPSGTAVEGWVALPGPPRRRVNVPAAALVRDGGDACVFVQVADDGFTRRVVRLDAPSGDGWLVSEGLRNGERVVVTGAQMLLSMERGGPAEEE